MATYLATEEMCYTEPDFGSEKLPKDWVGKMFQLTDDQPRTARLRSWERGTEQRSWTLYADSATKIRQENSPLAGITFEQMEAAAQARDDELGIKGEELRLERIAAETDRARARSETEALKKKVVDTAMDYAERHDWCPVVKEALEEMGLEVPDKEYAFDLTVTYRISGVKEGFSEPDEYEVNRLLDTDFDANMDGWGELSVEQGETHISNIERVEY